MVHQCEQKACKHESVKYCSNCEKVYCEKCGREWEDKCTLSHYLNFTYTYGTPTAENPYGTVTVSSDSQCSQEG